MSLTKTKNQIISFIATAVIFAVNAVGFAQSESDFKTDGKGTITAYEGWDTNIVIPAQIGGVSVTAIGDGAFSEMGLTSVTIPVGVTRIGNSAFADNNLKGVIIPAGVATIGNRAFSGNNLTDVIIPAGVTTIASNAFSDNKLTSLTLGSDIFFTPSSFGDYAFMEYMCNSRKAGTYNPSIKYTSKKEGDFEFFETKYGAYIVGYSGNERNRLIIPQKIAGVAVRAIESFERMGISRVQLPEGLVYIGPSAFKGNQLTNITIPDSVILIGSSAFAGNQLTSVTIPNGINSIYDSTFLDNQLTSVTIPDSVRFIEENAFASNQLTSVTIPDGVELISDGAFRSNKLSSVTIPDSVRFIEENAFAYNQLTSVTIPGSVVKISAWAFASNQLTSVTIPDSVFSFSALTFNDNGQLTRIIMPSGVTIEHSSIGDIRNFATLYNNNGKRAGTYVFDNNKWNMAAITDANSKNAGSGTQNTPNPFFGLWLGTGTTYTLKFTDNEWENFVGNILFSKGTYTFTGTGVDMRMTERIDDVKTRKMRPVPNLPLTGRLTGNVLKVDDLFDDTSFVKQ